MNSFANELAHEIGRDPVEFQLELIGEPAIIDLTEGEGRRLLELRRPDRGLPDRHRPACANVLRTARDVSGYGTDACPRGTASVSQCTGRSCPTSRRRCGCRSRMTEITPSPGSTRFSTVVWAPTPNGSGLSAKVRCRLRQHHRAARRRSPYTQGAVDQSNFHDYPVTRIDDAPLNVHLHRIENDHIPSGVGEPMVPPFAPALANAIFAATGKRVRSLPIRPEDIAGG